MQLTIDHGKETYSPYLMTRIQIRMEVCQALLKELRDFLSTLSPEMTPVWENLVSLLRGLAALNSRSKVGGELAHFAANLTVAVFSK